MQIQQGSFGTSHRNALYSLQFYIFMTNAAVQSNFESKQDLHFLLGYHFYTRIDQKTLKRKIDGNNRKFESLFYKLSPS